MDLIAIQNNPRLVEKDAHVSVMLILKSVKGQRLISMQINVNAPVKASIRLIARIHTSLIMTSASAYVQKPLKMQGSHAIIFRCGTEKAVAASVQRNSAALRVTISINSAASAREPSLQSAPIAHLKTKDVQASASGTIRLVSALATIQRSVKVELNSIKASLSVHANAHHRTQIAHSRMCLTFRLMPAIVVAH